MAGLFAGMICLGLIVDQIGRKWGSVTTASIMFVGERYTSCRAQVRSDSLHVPSPVTEVSRLYAACVPIILHVLRCTMPRLSVLVQMRISESAEY